MSDNPFAAPGMSQPNPFAAPGMSQPTQAQPVVASSTTPMRKEPEDTYGGVASAAARGLAPYAAGMTAGAALGAPLAGVGAVPGAMIGGAAVAGTDLALNLWNAVANLTGMPHAATVHEATDKLLDLAGAKPRSEMGMGERFIESAAGGAGGAATMARGAGELAKRVTGPITKRVMEKMAERPAAQAIGGAAGGAGAQGSHELGFSDPLSTTLAGLAGGAIGGTVADRRPNTIGRGAWALGMDPPKFLEEAARRDAVKLQNEARMQVSNSFNEGVRGGAPNAVTVMERLNEAKTEGQPYTLIDIENRPLQNLAGKTFRQGGEPQQRIYGFTTARNKGQRDWFKGLLKRYLSDESAMDTSEELARVRSVTGRPLWNIAGQGGSLAPLERQYQEAWVRAGQQEQTALRDLAHANQMVTIAAGQQATAGNVYSSSGANRSMLAAKGMLQKAEDDLAAAQRHKQMALDKMQTAQIDRMTDAPGAIWSPYLQEVWDSEPIIKAGIKQGFTNERREALAERRKINATDYALDEEGNLLPNKVPNMRTWMVAKEGLDSILNSDSMWRNGRPTKDAVPLLKLRDALVKELDTLNPDYGVARSHWGGTEASLRAIREGKDALLESAFSPEELKAHYGKLIDSDKQFFQIGLADALRKKLRHVGDNQDVTKIINEDVRERLLGIFGDDATADRFMNAVERSSQMKKTYNTIIGGAPSAERIATDTPRYKELLTSLADAFRSGFHYIHGSPWLGTGMAVRSVRGLLRDKPNIPRNVEIARILTDPNIGALIARGEAARAAGSQLFPLEQMPPGIQQRFLPGAAIGAGLAPVPAPQQQQR